MREQYIFAQPKKHGIGFLFIIFMLVLIIALAVVLNIINNGRVLVETVSVTVPDISSSVNGYSILVLDDLNGTRFGASQETFAAAIKNTSYKAVCITGDMVNKNGNYQPFLELLDTLKSDVPIFFVAGDADPAPLLYTSHRGENVKADYIVAAEEHGATYLDRPIKVETGKTGVVWFWPESLYALDLDATERALNENLLEASAQEDSADKTAMLRYLEYRLQIITDTREAITQMTSTDTQILVSHVPMSTQLMQTYQQWTKNNEAYASRPISLVIAGHSNGGQYRLPFVGAIYTPSMGWFPDDEKVMGLNVQYGITQFISPGLGVSVSYPLPFRLFNTPTATVLKLTNKLTEK